MAASSMFKFVQGKHCHQKENFANPQTTSAIWDNGSFLACNSKFLAVPWVTLGSVCVLNVDKPGRIPPMPALLKGHQGAVIDVTFNPFDDNLLFTGSEDATIKGWRIPDEGIAETTTESLITLSGHAKKAGTLSWHPAARNVLGSTAPDNTVKLWDVTKSDCVMSIDTTEVLTSLSWNLEGTQVCGSTKDRHLQIIDVRSGDTTVSVEAHGGAKTQHSVWAKKTNQIISVGFTRQQHRQAMVWDPRNMAKSLQVLEIDQGTAVPSATFDDDTGMLFVAGRGDTTTRLFHLWNKSTPMTYVNSFSFQDGQRGAAFFPKANLDIKGCEVVRLYRLGQKMITHTSFNVPRKTAESQFQKDLFPPTFSCTEPALEAEAFFKGENAAPRMVPLEGLWDGSGLGQAVAGDAVEASPVKETPKKEEKKEEAAAPAAEEKKPAETPESRRSSHVDPTAEPSEGGEVADSKPKFTEEEVQKQRDAVAALRKQLAEAEEKLREMEH